MKYKVGDRVKIKSLDWYTENKDEDGDVYFKSGFDFIEEMKKYCGNTMTIEKIFGGYDICPDIYKMKDDDNTYCWTEEMIECLVNPTKNMEPDERHFHICYQDAVGNINYTEVKLNPDEKANQETFSKKIFGDDKYTLIAWSLVEE